VGCAGTEFGRGGVAKRKKLLEKHLATIKKNKTFSTLKEPVLDLFLFNRIIIDEAHEVLADPLVTDLITSIPKRFGWYVSATPFPSEKLYTAAKIFLEILPIDFVDEKTIAGEYESYVENDIVYNNLVWRNTKESIHEEYLVPEYEEKLVEIDFTSIEQLVHDHDYFADKLALCSGSVSGPILDDLRDLQINEVKDMIKESKSEIERLKSQLKLLENHIQVAKEKIEEIDAAGSNYSTSMKKQEMQHRLNNFEYNRDDRQMALEREEKRLVEFESLSEKWSKTEYLLKGKEIRDNKQLAHLKLLNARGSKLTKLIEWLRESISKDKENRFIIFSKYTEYLYNIQNILRENKINSVTVEGTSAQKVKAIQQFKEENIKVIMLSLEKSASGLNLIEANHVVLLDPMDGTVEEARAVEVQALGRAHRQGQDQKVTLVRLVIKNSAEEELYLRNKSSGRDSKQGANNKSGKPILAKSNSATSLRNLAVFNEE
jgi:SNF2 family DNA or RNA helicase